MLGRLYTLIRKHDDGIAQCEQAVSLEPNSADAHFYLSLALRYAGRSKEAITMCRQAIRLNPILPSNYYQSLTNSYSLTRQYEEAVKENKKAIRTAADNLFVQAHLAAAYSLNEQEEEALVEAKEVSRVNPKFSVEHWARTMPYKNEAHKELIIGALRKAGLK